MRLTPYIAFAPEEPAMKTSTPDIEGCLCAKILAARVWASSALFGKSRASEVDLTDARNGGRRSCSGSAKYAGCDLPADGWVLCKGLRRNSLIPNRQNVASSGSAFLELMSHEGSSLEGISHDHSDP